MAFPGGKQRNQLAMPLYQVNGEEYKTNQPQLTAKFRFKINMSKRPLKDRLSGTWELTSNVESFETKTTNYRIHEE